MQTASKSWPEASKTKFSQRLVLYVPPEGFLGDEQQPNQHQEIDEHGKPHLFPVHEVRLGSPREKRGNIARFLVKNRIDSMSLEPDSVLKTQLMLSKLRVK